LRNARSTYHPPTSEMPDEPAAVCLLVEFEDQSKKACMRLTNISLIRNSGRAYLAVSGEGEHRLDEEFTKSVPQ
jgi:hypothetical protein